MAQPDLARLANAFTVISNEVTLLSNIPAVQQGQNLLGVINEMRDEMRDEMRQFRTEVTAVRTEVKALRNEVRTEVTALRTEVRAFRTELEDFRTEITERLDAENANTLARLFNSTIADPSVQFHPLNDRQNMPVPSFPRNGEALLNLSRVELMAILRAFKLPTDGDVDEKTKRLGDYIGIVKRVY